MGNLNGMCFLPVKIPVFVRRFDKSMLDDVSESAENAGCDFPDVIIYM